MSACLKILRPFAYGGSVAKIFYQFICSHDAIHLISNVKYLRTFRMIDKLLNAPVNEMVNVSK